MFFFFLFLITLTMTCVNEHDMCNDGPFEGKYT